MAHPRNPYGGAKALSDDEVEHVHRTALAQLEQHGVKVLLPEARVLFAQAGAIVDDDTCTVRIGADLAETLLSTIPSEYTLHARNPDHSLHIGGDSVVFFPVGGPPYSSSLAEGRRPGTLADFRDFTRLTQRCDVLHSVTPTVEAQDVPLNERHLRTIHTALVESDKPVTLCEIGRAHV